MQNNPNLNQIKPGDLIWLEHTVIKIDQKTVYTSGGNFKLSKIKKHFPSDNFKIGDTVQVIGEYQPESYKIVLFTSDKQKAVLSWFEDYYGVFFINQLKKVK